MRGREVLLGLGHAEGALLLLHVARGHHEVNARAVVGAARREHGEVELVELALLVAVLPRQRGLEHVELPVGRVERADALEPLTREVGIGHLARQPADHGLGVGDGPRCHRLATRERARGLEDLRPAALGGDERLEHIEDRVECRVGLPGFRERVDCLARVAEVVAKTPRDVDEDLGALGRLGRALERTEQGFDLSGSNARACRHAQLVDRSLGVAVARHAQPDPTLDGGERVDPWSRSPTSCRRGFSGTVDRPRSPAERRSRVARGAQELRCDP